MWVNSHSTSSQIHYFVLEFTVSAGLRAIVPKRVLLLYFHHFYLSSLPLCLSGLLNSCLHPLFHGALTVAGTVTPRQGLGLK